MNKYVAMVTLWHLGIPNESNCNNCPLSADRNLVWDSMKEKHVLNQSINC